MMTHFFDSTESIAEGVGFPLFGFGHLCWLAAFVVFAVVCSRIYKKSDAAKRQRIRYIFVALLLLDEAIKVIGLSVQGLFEPQYLPFHLCSINIFIILWHCKHQNNALNNYLFIVGIPAGMIALLTPSWTVLPFWNFMNIHSFTVHILLATYPIMLTYSGETNPQLKYLPGSLPLHLHQLQSLCPAEYPELCFPPFPPAKTLCTAPWNNMKCCLYSILLP